MVIWIIIIYLSILLFLLYKEDISKQFGGLQITDFPLYVQGLDNDGSHLIKHSLNDTNQAGNFFYRTLS